MKLALPSKKDCKYIRKKLKVFYEANINSDSHPSLKEVEFKRAMQRLFHFFQLPIPKVEWYKKLSYDNTVLGQCSTDGTLRLLLPKYHYDAEAEPHFESWLRTFYHEVGHYVLWYDTEKKAREFSQKMRDRD